MIPEDGTALTDLSTRARLDGSDYVLDGTKRWTSGAGHARYYVVYTRLADAPGAKGIGALLVCVAGWLATRSALSQPPMIVLRHG